MNKEHSPTPLVATSHNQAACLTPKIEASNAHQAQSLIALGRLLQDVGYQFTAITPSSHQTVLDRAQGRDSLRDLLGWSRPVPVSSVETEMVDHLIRAEAAEMKGSMLHPRVRAATLGGQLYFHSVFPTLDAESVFFGPDTYRTVRWLRQKVVKAERLVDVGSGSGAAGLSLVDRVAAICLCDINPSALRISRVNAEIAGVGERVEVVQSNILQGIDGKFDLVVANPPYLIDDEQRTYRHGGGEYGGELSLRIVRESLEKLPAGGRLVLYTASAIVAGQDTLYHDLRPLLEERTLESEYEEIDPDVFGEELRSGVYRDAERIAAVGLCLTKK